MIVIFIITNFFIPVFIRCDDTMTMNRIREGRQWYESIVKPTMHYPYGS